MTAFVEKYGPWALVAGASEGLGAAWADALAARGLKLLLLARREAALAETAAAIRAKHGVEVVTQAIDLGASGLVAALDEVTRAREVGLLVFNAAFSPQGLFVERPVDEHELAVAVNVRAPTVLAHHFGAQMAKRGRGGVVLMSSLTAFQGTPYLASYGATKAFNLALAEGLYTELRPRGVDVLACCAGATATPGYLRRSPTPQPGQLSPEVVVAEALESLGTRAFMVPGRFNRFASLVMRRVLPRARAVAMLASRSKGLLLHS